MVIGTGFTDRHLTKDEARQIVSEALATLPVDGQRVLVIIPDGTRTMPMPMMFDLLRDALGLRVAALDYLVALGTHPPMSDIQLSRLVGHDVIHGQVGTSHIFNHTWDDQANFAMLGTLPAREVSLITRGLMAQDLPVSLNKLILEYDQLLICGPVFPHEVAGFSGGNKYFFPGIAGPEIINFMHWLGAVITNFNIIGIPDTPVRALMDRAASLIDRPTACFGLVVSHEGLAGLYFGSAQDAWQAAATLSAQYHIIYKDKPFQRVLSVMPEMYADLWTAAKGMYKLEPAVADGGQVILYAPHITEVSYTHGKLIDEIGYHCRDYFMQQWDQFKHYPGSVLAHSTHVTGVGQYDVTTGVETARIQVTLATGIPADRCRRVNLDYLDPATLDPREWQGRESEGMLVVPRAGERLYRVKQAENK